MNPLIFAERPRIFVRGVAMRDSSDVELITRAQRGEVNAIGRPLIT
jgi:hypothetical protein